MNKMDKNLLQQHFPKLKFRHFNNETENTHETIVEESTIKKKFPNTSQGQQDAIHWIKEQFRRHINELQSLLNLN